MKMIEPLRETVTRLEQQLKDVETYPSDYPGTDHQTVSKALQKAKAELSGAEAMEIDRMKREAKP